MTVKEDHINVLFITVFSDLFQKKFILIRLLKASMKCMNQLSSTQKKLGIFNVPFLEKSGEKKNDKEVELCWPLLTVKSSIFKTEQQKNWVLCVVTNASRCFI